ncbi:hypothetical protein ASF49_03720 [Methylobacterium sp. Leaf104]|nr:hypothetical protein ASF49_03720 [Methylobacterium sp. Leaf104]
MQAVPVMETPHSPPEPQSTIEAQSTQESTTQAESLAEAIARLPRIEDLTAETELAPFLRAGIPAVLRKAALRRMWSVDPAIRDFVSEAREYAYDWNTPGGVPGLGPMLPTDDIKAMVERIMTGHAPQPAPETSASQEEEHEAELVVAPVAEEDPSAPQVLAAQVEPNPHVVEDGCHPSEKATRTFQSPPIVSRLRRHGGAMPS